MESRVGGEGVKRLGGGEIGAASCAEGGEDIGGSSSWMLESEVGEGHLVYELGSQSNQKTGFPVSPSGRTQHHPHFRPGRDETPPGKSKVFMLNVGHEVERTLSSTINV